MLFCNIHGKFTIKPRMPWYHIILSSVIWASPADTLFLAHIFKYRSSRKRIRRKYGCMFTKTVFTPFRSKHPTAQKCPSSKKAVNSKTLRTFPCAGPYQRKKYCMDRIILPFLSAAHKPIHRLIAVTTCVHISSLVSWYYKLFLCIHYHNFYPKKTLHPWKSTWFT